VPPADVHAGEPLHDELLLALDGRLDLRVGRLTGLEQLAREVRRGVGQERALVLLRESVRRALGAQLGDRQVLAVAHRLVDGHRVV